MSTFSLKWFGASVDRHVEDEIMKRLDKSGFIVEGEIKEVITQKGLIDTGLYRSSITHILIPERLTVRIGSPIGDLTNPRENPPYPLYLELGTWTMIAFAPMRTGLANSRSRLKSLWGASIVSVPQETGGETITKLPPIRG
jgi:hypothetical protein